MRRVGAFVWLLQRALYLAQGQTHTVCHMQGDVVGARQRVVMCSHAALHVVAGRVQLFHFLLFVPAGEPLGTLFFCYAGGEPLGTLFFCYAGGEPLGTLFFCYAGGEPLGTLFFCYAGGRTAGHSLSYCEFLLDAATVCTDHVDTTDSDVSIDGFAWLDGEVSDGETTHVNDAYICLTT